jgi:hypothetical protein
MEIVKLELTVWEVLESFTPDVERGVFQTSAWMSYVLGENPGARNCSMAFVEDGDVVGVLPLATTVSRLQHEYWSHLHDEYGGLIVLKRCDGELISQIELLLFASFRPLRMTCDPLLTSASSYQLPWKRASAYTHVLELPATYDQWFNSTIRAACRNQIRKSMKCELYITREKQEDDVTAYHELYLGSFARWKSPPKRLLPVEHFRRLLALPHSDLYLARQNGRAVAGMIVLNCPTYSFYYCGAMDKDAARTNPTYLLMDRVIAESIGRKQRFVNMGGSNQLAAVEAFKENFGAIRRAYDVLYTDTWYTRAGRAFDYYVSHGPDRVKSLQRRFSRLAK